MRSPPGSSRKSHGAAPGAQHTRSGSWARRFLQAAPQVRCGRPQNSDSFPGDSHKLICVQMPEAKKSQGFRT